MLADKVFALDAKDTEIGSSLALQEREGLREEEK